MSHFILKARKPNGETYTEEREAKDRYELYRMLHDSGDELMSLKEKAAGHGFKLNFKFSAGGGHVKMEEKINFARNLGSMLEAGLALSRALSVLERQTRNKKFKSLMTSIIDEVNKGIPLAEALGKHPKIFPPLFISMVHAGEQSGNLADSLKVVALQMDRNHTLQRRIKGALIYPSVIVFAMVIIAILMFLFVVPTLMKTFTELHVELPLPTRVVLGISNLIQHQGLWVLLGFVVLVTLFLRWVRTPRGKKIMHLVMIKLPIFGFLVREVNTARTARTLSSLLNSGVDVVESVKITESVLQNVHFKSVLNDAGKAIGKGEPMSTVFSKAEKLYPVFFAEMMSVGEETGKTAEMLLGVAHYYEEDVEQKTKDMSTVIEPLLMIIIAAGVGFFAVAMITPMYSLVNAI